MVKERTEIEGAHGWQPRGVQFTNGQMLIAWVEQDGRLGYAFLENNFDLAGGYPQYFERVNRRSAGYPSVALDHLNRAVITFLDDSVGDSMFYVLINQERVVMTPPVIFISERNGDPAFVTSEYGFGNAGYRGVSQSFLPLLKKMR
jgi:hypothetical protein